MKTSTLSDDGLRKITYTCDLDECEETLAIESMDSPDADRLTWKAASEVYGWSEDDEAEFGHLCRRCSRSVKLRRHFQMLNDSGEDFIPPSGAAGGIVPAMRRDKRLAAILDLQVSWETSDEESVLAAEGDGILLFRGEPFWAFELPVQAHTESVVADKSVFPVFWPWVDLLEFLIRAWPVIQSEESYPFGVKPTEPIYFEDEIAEDLKATDYTHSVLRFHRHHDFSSALGGIHLPSLIVMREGDLLWFSSGLGSIQVDLRDGLQVLSRIGDKICARIEQADKQHNMVLAWKHRPDAVTEKS